MPEQGGGPGPARRRVGRPGQGELGLVPGQPAEHRGQSGVRQLAGEDLVLRAAPLGQQVPDEQVPAEGPAQQHGPASPAPPFPERPEMSVLGGGVTVQQLQQAGVVQAAPAELEDPVAEQRVLHRLAPARGIGQAEPVAAERVHTRGVALDRRVACGEHGRESPAVDRGAPVDPVEGLGDGQEDLPDDAVRRGEPDVVLRAEQESPEGHLREGGQIAHHKGLGCADDVQDAQLPRPDRAAAPAARRPGVPRPHRGRPDQQPGTPPHRSLCTHDSFLTSACPTRRSCPPGSGAARTGRESRRPGCDVRHLCEGPGVQGVR